MWTASCQVHPSLGVEVVVPVVDLQGVDLTMCPPPTPVPGTPATQTVVVTDVEQVPVAVVVEVTDLVEEDVALDHVDHPVLDLDPPQS